MKLIRLPNGNWINPEAITAMSEFYDAQIKSAGRGRKTRARKLAMLMDANTFALAANMTRRGASLETITKCLSEKAAAWAHAAV